MANALREVLLRPAPRRYLALSSPRLIIRRIVRGLTRTAFAATSVVTHPELGDASANCVRWCPWACCSIAGSVDRHILTG